MLTDRVVVTCEHAGNRVPREYRRILAPLDAALETHRGYDAGALRMAENIAAAFDAPLVTATVTRLLVDLNRSTWNATLHSDPVRATAAATRDKIIAEHYLPYRSEVENAIADAIGRGHRVMHISSHSFTPELNGEVRNADIGLLYDPRRAGERRFCALWKAAFVAAAPDLRVRRNYPYAGKNDGFTAVLRQRHGPHQYVGIELEINQAHVFAAGSHWSAMRSTVVATLKTAFVTWAAPDAAPRRPK